jgi:hypothetical protein
VLGEPGWLAENMDMIEYAHYEFIEDALYEGKQVPREILEKYSDLDASWLKKRPLRFAQNRISWGDEW